MFQQKPIGILIVDNHAMVRSSLVTFINSFDDLECLGSAKNAQEAITAAAALSPDIILLDLRLPDMKGAEVIQKIRRQSPYSKIIVLSGYFEAAQVQALIKAGASAYFTKTSTSTELLNLIHAVYRDKTSPSTPPLTPSPAQHAVRPSPNLSKQEQNVLLALAQGLDDNTIAQQFSLSQISVNFYKKRLLLKFDVSRYEDVIVRARDRGIIP
ncbi:MAG: response regulator transcription factor [Chloroflexi bacterium]|nr:response regulator transcription factor [Chloroflexota bacterium]